MTQYHITLTDPTARICAYCVQCIVGALHKGETIFYTDTSRCKKKKTRLFSPGHKACKYFEKKGE